MLSVEDELIKCTHPHKTLQKYLARVVVSLEFHQIFLQTNAIYGGKVTGTVEKACLWVGAS